MFEKRLSCDKTVYVLTTSNKNKNNLIVFRCTLLLRNNAQDEHFIFFKGVLESSQLLITLRDKMILILRFVNIFDRF